MESVDPKKLVSVAELAKEFGYSREHLSRLAASGKIKAWQVAKSWVTTRETIKEYIRSNPLPGRPVRSKKKK